MQLDSSCEGRGSERPQWAEVQRAESRIRAQAAQACSCRSDGSSGSCIPCSLIPDLLDYLDRSVVHYQQSLGPHICAQAPNVFNYMRLAQIAFDPDSCDCLASTIYHELLHNIGWNHTEDPARDPVNAAEQKCKGDLCGNNVVEAIIVH